uniref:Uncharacterized protein n=1 Tax=Caenorhabditis japonica TaxID=281687 RepID=A0A8R1IIP8_CAEJA
MDPPRISPPAAVHVPMTSKEMLAEPSGLNPSFGKTAGLVCTLCSADIGALCLGCKGETTLRAQHVKTSGSGKDEETPNKPCGSPNS